MKIYEESAIYVEIEPHAVPWLKVFTTEPYKEFSDCPEPVRRRIWEALDVIEKGMLEYYRPIKVNIASFGNYLPRVHFHIQARFKEDPYFPEPTWGKQQRESALHLPPMAPFIAQVIAGLEG